MAKKYPQGKHPNSLANLHLDERQPKFGEPKKNRNVSLTDSGWAGLLALKEKANCSSVSDLLDKIGRGELDFPVVS